MTVKAKAYSYLVRTASVMAIVAGSGLVSVSAQAQSVFEDEIVVTATKKEENLQDVGVSVTAFTGDQLEALGLTSSIDLIAQTPGIEVSGSGGGAINSFSIRGTGQNDFAANQEGPVAVYIDDGYISSNTVTAFSLFDIERVEVLRGPQGTLYGRNATGGLVHYITSRPTENTEGFLDLEVGEQGRVRIEGASGGSIGKNAQVRLSAVYNRNDGLIENLTGENLQKTDDFAIRGQLAFQPSEDVDVLLKAQIADGGGNRGGYVDGTLGNYTTSTDFAGRTDSNVTDLSAYLRANLGSVDLVSITNYQSYEHDFAEDSDMTPFSIYHYAQNQNVDQISQEFRLNFDGAGYEATVGTFFMDINGDCLVEQSGEAPMIKSS